MTRDAQLVLALLQTLNDWMPGPTTWRKNPLSYRSDSGEAPSTTVACPTCGGHGRRGRTSCAPCNGTGQVTVDAYTERTVATETQHVTRTRTVRCDSCGGDGAHPNGRRCRYCDGTGQRHTTERIDQTLHLAASSRSSVDDERKLAHYRTGSYRQLEHALQRLEATQPVAHSLLILLVVYDSPAIRTPRVQAVLDATCELLAHWMPKPIKAPRNLMAASPPPKGNGAGRTNIAQRNETVRQLRAQGHTLNAIGKQMNLTRQRVHQILDEP